MARRNRARRAAAESMFDFYVRTRPGVDTSIDADIARSCSSKRQYASESEARAFAALNGMSGALFTYQCRYCEFWHLTRRPGPSSPTNFSDQE